MNNAYDKLCLRYLLGDAHQEDIDAFMAMLRSGNYEVTEAFNSFMECEFMLLDANPPVIQASTSVEGDDLYNKIWRDNIQPHMIVDHAHEHRQRGNYLWKAAAIFIVAVLLGGSYFAYRLSESNKVLNRLSGKRYAHLPDGSTVMLNNGSTVTYDLDFGASHRKLHLIGEAYFDVKRGQHNTFTITCGDVVIEVTGTAFNVKAHSRDRRVVVTVVHGSVKVGDAYTTYANVRPNEQLIVDTDTGGFKKIAVNAGKDITWINSFLMLEEVTLEAAAEAIARAYNVKVTIACNELKKAMIKHTSHDEPVTEVLDVVCKSINGEYTMVNGSITITGESCR